MQISEIILERIKKNHSLDSYMKGAVSKIDKHISSSPMVFFPEYTDHNITHLEAVLETAIDLATDKSLELMTDVDLVVLTTSVMLHDLGMHLTKDGFQTLIGSNSPLKPIDGFSDPPWEELWLTFLVEARRFDAKMLTNIFGPNYLPVTSFPSFDDPWHEFDFLLVGEFLRRHHPRLAHEIAVRGMPSKNGKVIQFCGMASEQEEFLSDISGLVARSHGMALRQTFPYLDNKYGNRIEARSARPVYLMTLIRIADYLQIQSTRAPSARTNVTKFRSPVSTREWSVHQSVTDITNLSDPEAIDISAKPDNIKTFLRLKHWISDLQDELDLSWAVLGEVYGLQAHNGLNKFGLRIRRLRSNIDVVNEFAKTVNYIPEQISFTTAGSDLLKLLVGPLYANQVSVGLRELIQNATDSVKELDSLVDQGSTPPALRNDISADVQVDFAIGTNNSDQWRKLVKTITITDRGMGMTPEILQNYFLKAGASFRNSSAWKNSFEKTDGSSQVQRSGRFGVGALAAFLLGDEINIETRHYSTSSKNGLQFSANLESSSINVERGDFELGTKIRIDVPERLQKKIGDLLPNGDFSKVDLYNGVGEYFGRYPELVYTEDGSKIPWDETCLLPTQKARFEDPWNYFSADNFEVNWTYYGNGWGLAVNQIRIAGERKYRSSSAEDTGVRIYSNIFSVPSLSIGDNSGSFELNLQRSKYAASKLPFCESLLREITDEFIFECLWQLINRRDHTFPAYIGFHIPPHYEPSMQRWFECSDGIILNEPQFLKQYCPNFGINRYGGQSDPGFFQKLIGVLPERSIYSHDANDSFAMRKYSMKGKLTRILRGDALNSIQSMTENRTVFVPSSFTDLIIGSMKPGKKTLKLIKNLKEDTVSDWLVQLGVNLSEPSQIRKSREGMDKDGNETSIVSLHSLSRQKIETWVGNRDKIVFDRWMGSSDKIVFDRWMELLEQPYLPRSTADLVKLQRNLSEKIGRKYEVFERRKKEVKKKKEYE